ncbi:MAG TPA: peptidoglycan-binding protein, partial [Tabrizicola sp.]|nr:peptidoglycan-binding protein [Tabrizicola sp.]
VPEFDFGNKVFRFCIPSSVNFDPDSGLAHPALRIDDIQLAIDFHGHDSGLWAFVPWNGGCKIDQPFRDKYAASPGAPGIDINVSNSVPVHFPDEADAERIYRAMTASPDGLIETRVRCSALQNPYEGQVFPRCWVTAIDVGRNPDGSAWFSYAYTGTKDWTLTVAPEFLFPGATPVATTPPAADASLAPVPTAEPLAPTTAPDTAGKTAEALMADVLALNAGLAAATPKDRRAVLEKMRALLDRIVSDHPDSDLALMIVLEVSVEGVDVAALNRDLTAAPDPTSIAAPVVPEPVAPMVEPTSPTPAPVAPAPTAQAGPADAVTETALALDDLGWRDVQARLLVLGHDPNGIDGQPGRGTRQALSTWQAASGVPASGYLAADHLALLVSQSQDALDLWLQDPANKERHTPPPPIELTANAVNGTWSFTATCGKNSAFPGQTITGAMKLALGSGRSVAGTVRNSQGFNGKVSGQIDGRRMSGVINWGLLLGKVSFSGRIAAQSLSFSGQDSNGCRLKARKG